MDEPRLNFVVAPPARLTVVAVVLSKSKEDEPVVKLVVIAGEVPKTATPLPVSSDKMLINSAEVAAAATVVRFFDPSVTTKAEAFKPEKVIVPEEANPVAAVIAPDELT